MFFDCLALRIKHICFSLQGDLVTCGVLSGNKNFEGRLCDCVRANYLASPPLVVAYAIAGTVNIDFQTEPLGVFSYILSVCLYVFCAYFLPEVVKTRFLIWKKTGNAYYFRSPSILLLMHMLTWRTLAVYIISSRYLTLKHTLLLITWFLWLIYEKIEILWGVGFVLFYYVYWIPC